MERRLSHGEATGRLWGVAKPPLGSGGERSLVPPVHQQQCSWMGLSPSQLERSHPCRSKTASGIKDGLLPFPTPQVGLPCTTLPMSRMSLKEATLLQYGNHHLPALTETLEAE